MVDSKKKDLFLMDRRDFVKNTAVGVAGVALTYAGLNLGKLIIGNEAIAQIPDQFRVVQIYNAGLTKTANADGFAAQNDPVNGIQQAIVNSSMDQGVMCLTQTSTPQAAWAKIIPTSIPLNQAVVGIKVNYFNTHMATHAAVVTYVINSLANAGILRTNIYVYDGPESNSLSGSSTNLKGALGNPTDVKVANYSRSGTYSIAGHSTGVVSILDDGTVDWIINLAAAKTHWDGYGGMSLTLKNHFGSFSPVPGPGNTHYYDGYLAGINSTCNVPASGGSTLLAKTILCAVDAIYACLGCCGATAFNPNKIFLGKNPLAVDYLVAKNLLSVPTGSGGMGSTVNWTRVQAWADTEGAFGINYATLQTLPLITNCATDTIKPKAPTNLNVIKG